MIGVTSLTPLQACMVDKASDLQGQSFVLCASNGVSSLFVGGQVRRGGTGRMYSTMLCDVYVITICSG